MIQRKDFCDAQLAGGDYQAGIRQVHRKIPELVHQVPTLEKVGFVHWKNLKAASFQKRPEILLRLP